MLWLSDKIELLKTTRLPIKRGKAPNRLVKERHFLAGGVRGGQRPPRMGRIMPFIVGNRAKLSHMLSRVSENEFMNPKRKLSIGIPHRVNTPTWIS